MKFLRLIFILFLSGCQEQLHQSENYQLTSVADLTLTPSNHPHGYQKTNCFACHVPANIHTVNRINAPSFDLAAPLVAQSGIASCSACHGTNGASP